MDVHMVMHTLIVGDAVITEVDVCFFVVGVITQVITVLHNVTLHSPPSAWALPLSIFVSHPNNGHCMPLALPLSSARS